MLSKDEGKVMATILHNRQQFKNYAKALNLAVCYAANAGGVGTIAGTATTLIIKAYMDEYVTLENPTLSSVKIYGDATIYANMYL